MPRCTRPSEVVEIDIEPLVDTVVNLEVVVADFLRSLALLKSLDFSGSAVFVGTTDVKHIVAVESLVAGEYVG